MHGLGELRGLVEIGRRGLAPEHVRVRRVRERARDRRLDARRDAEEALRRALAGRELAVALVDVAREQRRGERVGARDEHGRDVEDVGGEPRGDERADELARRDEHLAAEVAALLLRGELILEVDAGGAGLDERLHELERVQRPAEAGLGVGDDRREPVGAVLALRRVDLVGAQERAVDALHERGRAVRGIEALVGVRVPGEVRVGGDLPAGEVDRLQARLHHLHALRAGQRAERGDVLLGVQQLPEPLGAEARERVLDPEPPADALDVVLRVRPLDSVPAAVRLACAHLGTSPARLCAISDRLDPKCAFGRRQCSCIPQSWIRQTVRIGSTPRVGTIARHGPNGSRRRRPSAPRSPAPTRRRATRSSSARRCSPGARARRGRSPPARDDEPPRPDRRRDRHREDANAPAHRRAALGGRRLRVRGRREGRRVRDRGPRLDDGPAKKRASELGLDFTPAGFPVEYLSLGGIGPVCRSARRSRTSARCSSRRCSARTRRRSRASRSSSTTPTRRGSRSSTSPTSGRC